MLILSFAFFAVAAISLPLIFIVGQQAAGSSSWPTVQGEITQSKVDRISLGKKTKFQADVLYLYQVGGDSFIGSRIRYLDTSGSSEKAQLELIEPYAVGTTTDVYYDPNHPGNSVLEPGRGSSGSRLFFYAIPLILGGIGAFLFLAQRQP
ncbi:MAG: DUF3592 domain-containing protein [Planctomycetota bacterium]